MAVPRVDPLPGFRFVVTLINTSSTLSALASSGAGLLLGGFAECSGLESVLETVDYLEGGVNDRVHRFPSRLRYANIVLKRGVAFSEDLWLWHDEFVRGEGKRRDGLIVLQNDLRVPIKIWTFTRGLPVKWTGPTFNAAANELAVEALEIAHEKLELATSPGKIVGTALPI